MVWPHTAWALANLYLGSLEAELLSDEAPRIVGMSVETTCYVSPAYFGETSRFADYLVHEAAHIFHLLPELRSLVLNGFEGGRQVFNIGPAAFDLPEHGLEFLDLLLSESGSCVHQLCSFYRLTGRTRTGRV